MWLLNCDTVQLESFEGEERPPYAILSHRWEDKEVSYQDVMAGNHVKQKGWQKIRSCCEQAKRDGLNYVWADTCCIDKKSSAEMSEAINSMFRWYRQAKVCYAYLADVDSSLSTSAPPESIKSSSLNIDCEAISGYSADDDDSSINTNAASAGIYHVSAYSMRASPAFNDQDFTMPADQVVSDHNLVQLLESVWFTRGWTLQELIAPYHLIFYDRHWVALGTKLDFCDAIEHKAGIRAKVLKGADLSEICTAEKMTWAAGRKTTRVEDRAYSLLGIFNVNMPLLYGEGDKAFTRLQNELIRESDDLSILAWSPSVALQTTVHGALLAASPDCFHWDPNFIHFVPMASQVSAHKGWLTAKVVLRPIGLLLYVFVLGMVISRSTSRQGEPRQSYPIPNIHSYQARGPASDRRTIRRILGIVVGKNITNDHWERAHFNDEYILFPEPYRRTRLDDWKAACWSVTLEPRLINNRLARSTYGLDPTDLPFTSAQPWFPGTIRPKGTILSTRSENATNEWLQISPSAPSRSRIKCIYSSGCGRYSNATFVVEFVYSFTSIPIARLHRLDGSGLPIHFDDREDAGSDKRVLEKYTMGFADPMPQADSRDRQNPTDSGWDTAFEEIEKEKNNGTGADVVDFGDSFKAPFIPLDGGHRVLLAFSGARKPEGGADHDECIRHLPRQWLYPPEREAWRDELECYLKDYSMRVDLALRT